MQSGEDPTRYLSPPVSSGQGWRDNGVPAVVASAAGGAHDMSLDLQLSEMRRSLDVATTKIDGQLAVLLQRSDYAEQRARESAERFAAELAMRDVRAAGYEARMDKQDERSDRIERKVYFMAGMAAAVGSATGIVVSIITHGH